MNQIGLLGGLRRTCLPMHGMVEAGARVVVDVMCQHRPDLSGVFVGDGHDDLAEQHPPIE